MMESFPPGLTRVGEPSETSPVLVTGNFQETARLLETILNTCGTPAFLLMSDTKGYSVDNAIEEKRFSPIIPGLARHLAGQIKQTTGWEVAVGPVSGLELPLFLVKK
jgi:CO dehydrogenase/acetyl-CoA synthase gamma subunit (corrinoid Fe-S protein)